MKCRHVHAGICPPPRVVGEHRVHRFVDMQDVEASPTQMSPHLERRSQKRQSIVRAIRSDRDHAPEGRDVAHDDRFTRRPKHLDFVSMTLERCRQTERVFLNTALN